MSLRFDTERLLRDTQEKWWDALEAGETVRGLSRSTGIGHMVLRYHLGTVRADRGHAGTQPVNVNVKDAALMMAWLGEYDIRKYLVEVP